MTARRRARNRSRTFLACALAAVLASAAFAGTANATPAWYFDGVELEGEESVVNGPPPNFFTIPGLTTACEMFPLGMTIANAAKQGTAKVVELPTANCSTNSPVCTVEAFGAASLPWAAKLTTISEGNYLVIEGVRFQILYGGEECVLNEALVEVKGSAGGRVQNSNESIMFSGIAFKATGTKLTTLGQPLEWLGALTLRATGPHQGQALTVE